MIRKIRNGLINKACIDYLREGEYGHYWYVIGNSILDFYLVKFSQIH